MLFLSVTSCEKDKEVYPVLTALIDGNRFTASYIYGIQSLTDNVIRIGGYGSDGEEELEITIHASGAGTYSIDSTNVGSFSNAQLFITSFGLDTPDGKIVITTYDSESSMISGTFYFEGIDLKGKIHNISEGVFENLKLNIE